MNLPNKLRPSYLLDTLIALFLKIVLAILLKILYFVKGEKLIVTKVEVTIKKANEEKQYTHVLDASKDRAIKPKDLINEPDLTDTPSDTNKQQIAEEEMKTNLITSTPSELKPEEIKDDIINNKNDKSEEYGIESTPEIQGKREIPRLETGPFEMKTSHNNNNNNGSNTIPFEFYWKNGGKEVIITGDFDNWQCTHKMNFNPETNNFAAVIDIDTNKQHEFKFIVDGVWQPNWDLPTRTDDHGNVNNIIYAFPSDPLSPEYNEYAAPSFQLTAAY